MHKKLKGKLSVKSKVALNNKTDLSIAYTPGVAEPCRLIHKKKKRVYDYTIKSNMVAVVTDGSAVLGLGNIGAEASIPVMEGKAVLFKKFADVDAFPIALATQNVDEIVETVKRIAPVFGAINLEDISAPRCFEVEERLRKELDIPVFHDDQHGTAIVTLAGLINALKLAKKKIFEVKIVLSGAGSAGIAITKLLLSFGAKNIILCDTSGIIYSGRKKNMNFAKKEIAMITNKNKLKGTMSDAVKDSDVFIGISAPKTLTKKMVLSMNDKPIIFAMANPVPEIMPSDAKKAGAFIIATGRSDFSNQINNVLAFPGVLKGLLYVRKQITSKMSIAVAKAIAKTIKPTKNKIIPLPFDKRVVENVFKAMKK